MYSTLVYLYNQEHYVLTPEILSTKQFNIRWEPVYAKNLKLNRGVDNKILIQCYNQDQKPVNVSDSFFVFRIIDREDEKILFSKVLDVIDSATGKLALIAFDYETAHIPAQVCSYSISRHNYEDYSSIQNALVEPVFVDDHAGARGTIEIVDSVLPKKSVPGELNVPTLTVGADAYTSDMTPTSTGITTFQLFLKNFTGIIQPQASFDDDGLWFDVLDPLFIHNDSPTRILTVMGKYDNLRLKITTDSGNIEKILFR